MENRASYNPEKCKVGICSNEEIDFDKALDIAGFGRYNIYLTVACGFGLFAVNTTVYAIGYVLPAAECDLNLSTSDKGLLTAVVFLGIIFSLYFWGALADTIGRKKIILISLIGGFISTVAAVLTASFWLFTTLLFLNGVLISGSSCTLYAYLGEFHSNSRRSGAIAWGTVCMNFALAVLPVTAWISISQTFSFEVVNFTFLPWRLFVLLCGLPSLFAAIAITMFPESPKYLVLKGRTCEAVDVLKRIYAVNSRGSADAFPVQSFPKIVDSNAEGPSQSLLRILKNVWYQTIPLLQREHRKYILITCFLQFGVFAISSGLLLWYPDILNKLSASYNTYPNSTFTVCDAITTSKKSQKVVCGKINFSVYQQNIIIGVAYCIGCSLVGLLINCFGKRRLLVINLLVPAVCCIALTFVTSSIAVDVLFIIVLVPPGLCVAIITAAVVDIFPTHFRAIAISMCLLMGRLGSVVASTTTGYLLEISCSGTFYAYAALTLGCVCLSLFIPDRKYS